MKFYYKVIIFLLSFSIYINISVGQNKLISGKVFDEAGKPVAYASITFKPRRKGGAWTYKDGSYNTYIPIGSDSIVCSHINFIKKSEKIEGNDLINFTLEKQPPKATTISVTGTHKYTTEEKNKLQNKREEKFEDIIGVFTRIEISASFKSGETGFQKYLESEIVYPDSATISDVKGVVKVGFIVGIDGTPNSVALVKGINKLANELVLNAIQKMPKWIPAQQNGRYVEQYKEVSVSFDIIGIDQ